MLWNIYFWIKYEDIYHIIGTLHIGHVLDTLNQLFMQNSWKLCFALHGNITILSPILKLWKQIRHSGSDSSLIVGEYVSTCKGSGTCYISGLTSAIALGQQNTAHTRPVMNSGLKSRRTRQQSCSERKITSIHKYIIITILSGPYSFSLKNITKKYIYKATLPTSIKDMNVLNHFLCDW
jgi:hypothetical protein